MPPFIIMCGHAVSLNLNVFLFLQKLFPWVGLRKINVSYWGWEDNSPFTNTSLQWLPGEPNDSGFCAYLERAQVSGLRANPCNANTDGLICEKAVGERGSLYSSCRLCFWQFSSVWIKGSFFCAWKYISVHAGCTKLGLNEMVCMSVIAS